MNHPASFDKLRTGFRTERAALRLGEFELLLASDGLYHPDGGAFFGVVPKTLWEKKAPADSLNHIRAGTNALLVRGGRQTILIETGIGDKLDPKFAAFYGIERERGLPEDLRARGVDPAEVDLVVNTHLHFDHCGWNTRRVNGRIEPTFPKARYFVQRGEWEHAHRRLERDRVSYYDENYDPLISTGQMTLLDGDTTLAPGISVEVHSGHTRNMQVVLVQSGGRTCAFLSDLFPTIHHLKPTWVLAYDLFPLESIENKKKLLERAAGEEWLCVFVHDPDCPWGYVRREGESYRFEPA